MSRKKVYSTYWVATPEGWKGFVEKNRSQWLIECRKWERLTGNRPRTELRKATFSTTKHAESDAITELYIGTEILPVDY